MKFVLCLTDKILYLYVNMYSWFINWTFVVLIPYGGAEKSIAVKSVKISTIISIIIEHIKFILNNCVL